MDLWTIVRRVAVSLQVFEVEEKYRGTHLSVYERGYQEYVHRRAGTHFTAILPYAVEPGGPYVYVHSEPRLPHEDTFVLIPSCVTGSVEPGETPFENAQKELKEEIGFDVPFKDRWMDLGEMWSSKVTDEVYHTFAVDVSNLELREAQGDGSMCEEISQPTRLMLDQALDLVKDSLFHAMVGKLQRKGVGNGLYG